MSGVWVISLFIGRRSVGNTVEGAAEGAVEGAVEGAAEGAAEADHSSRPQQPLAIAACVCVFMS